MWKLLYLLRASVTTAVTLPGKTTALQKFSPPEAVLHSLQWLASLPPFPACLSLASAASRSNSSIGGNVSRGSGVSSPSLLLPCFLLLNLSHLAKDLWQYRNQQWCLQTLGLTMSIWLEVEGNDNILHWFWYYGGTFTNNSEDSVLHLALKISVKNSWVWEKHCPSMQNTFIQALSLIIF